MKVPSLWAGRTARKSRMTIMVAASVLAHTVLVAVGTMWHPGEPRKDDTTVITFEPEPMGNNEPALPTPVASTPTPVDPLDTKSEVGPTPSLIVEDLDQTIPAPTPRAVSTPTRPARTSVATTHTGPTGPPTAAVSTGLGGSPSGTGIARGQTGWMTPHPSYPPRAREMRLHGATTVRVTTDASGNVVEVVILKSAGNILLDSATQSFVRSHWKGPANSSHTAEFVYQMP